MRGEKWSPKGDGTVWVQRDSLRAATNRTYGTDGTYKTRLAVAVWTMREPHVSPLTNHVSLLTVRGSAEHNLDCSLNGRGLGLYPGAELIFRGCFKRDRVGTVIEGEISGFGHHGELFVPDTTLD